MYVYSLKLPLLHATSESTKSDAGGLQDEPYVLNLEHESGMGAMLAFAVDVVDT